MEGLIAELKNMADVVILDTAPAQLLADAALMARFVDAALYVIRYDYTKMYKIREGIQALAMSKIKMLMDMATDMDTGAMAATAITEDTGTQESGIRRKICPAV